MKNGLVILFCWVSLTSYCQKGDSIFIKISDCKNFNEHIFYKFSHYWDSIQGYKSFSIIVGHTITQESKKDKAAYFLEMPALGEAVDSIIFRNKIISNPRIIMDSLTKYRFDYERRNSGKFYVIIKGQGPIWYLHKAALTYMWAPDETEEYRKKLKDAVNDKK